MYDTTEEARQKLEQSTVLFEGVPVLVTGAEGSKGRVRLGFVPLPFNSSTDAKIVPINDKGWDFKSLPSKLGYVNLYGGEHHKNGAEEAVFVTRVPTRASRQGVDNRTVKLIRYGQETVTSLGEGLQWSHVMSYEGILKTVNGNFPSAKEACKKLIDGIGKVKSVAISRKLMMIFDRVNPPNLIYRNEKIGYSEDGTTFRLAPHKQFLAEELQDLEGLKIA